ncbi:ATP-binding cassette domain-containing protein [Leptolyngbyaceae cyanobacterium CCMR0082]|uniref:ATP-binding cassette domain-containing protein n=1 Tax=Adonisia turfae CCMR0082 TaxID=2304604 RepID=A0A6M0SFD5_9CYAN|nr:ATP-binding cassette domain-containing protein [Adonisia turfae]NEZ67016.1 ATP-binding cassette domain-containing protein [Adonisia turfae CCMR0082]
MPAIEVKNLTKVYPVAIKQPGLAGTLRHFFQRQYRQVKAVNNVSFSIEPGEVVGFLGPNGAGKTTTLKMLTGLIYPSSGQVSVAGQLPFQRQRSFLEHITLVMGQKQQLIWDLPTLDSLRINGAIYGLSHQELRDRIHELSKMLDLTDKLTQPVRKLSLGERMKAEMLAALLHHPQVLFLDEPTLGLDVNAQMAVRNFLQAYNRRYQATIVLTSHYMADITALCDRVLLIYQGQLIYDGSLNSLIEQFAPYREVTAELAQEIPAASLEPYGEIQSIDGCKVVLLVRREDLTKTVSQVLAQLPVHDLTVTDPPIEDVIGRVFDIGLEIVRN